MPYVIVSLVCLLLGAASAHAASLCTFTWVNPTTNAQGGAPAYPQVGTYLYRKATPALRVAAVLAPLNTVSNIPCDDGQVFFATAYDSMQMESGPSNEVLIAPRLAPPGSLNVSVRVDVQVNP